jgi:hypothetical protein
VKEGRRNRWQYWCVILLYLIAFGYQLSLMLYCFYFFLNRLTGVALYKANKPEEALAILQDCLRLQKEESDELAAGYASQIPADFNALLPSYAPALLSARICLWQLCDCKRGVLFAELAVSLAENGGEGGGKAGDVGTDAAMSCGGGGAGAVLGPDADDGSGSKGGEEHDGRSNDEREVTGARAGVSIALGTTEVCVKGL